MNKLFCLKAGMVLMMALFLVFPLLAYEGAKEEISKNIPSKAVLKEYGVTNNSRPTLRFNQKEVFSPNGTYHVSINKKGQWMHVGEIQADKYLRKSSVDLTRWVKNGEIHIRIEEKDGGAAHIDCVAINGLIPSNLGSALTKKLSKRDNDVIDAFGKSFEFTFENVQTNRRKPVLLELTARIEPERIDTTPFQYPLVNMFKEMTTESEFYTYEIGSQYGKLTIDGELSTETLEEPFFTEFFPTGSGHPDAKIHGWVQDDGENLYVAIDFLGDNTMDGGKDYTKVYINTDKGLREFKVTAEQKQWGKPGFTYTDKVRWQHKAYEFAIPLNEIRSDIDSDQPLQLAFAAYGTCIPSLESDPPADLNGVDPDSGPSGTTFTFTVGYGFCQGTGAPTLSQVWIDLDGDSEIDIAKLPLVLILPTNFTDALLLLIPATLLLLFLIFCKRLRLLKPGIVFAALIALAAIGFTSCSLPSAANTVQEVYDMTRVNTGAPDWENGELMSADVQIYAPSGNYTFDFIFKDDDGDDVTIEDLTLTIE